MTDVSGVIESLNIKKEYKGNLAAFEMVVGGQAVNGYGDFPQELRNIGQQVDVETQGSGRNVFTRVKPVGGSAASAPKSASSYSGGQPGQVNAKDDYWNRKEEKDDERNKQQHAYGAITLALNTMNLAMKASEQHMAAEGKPALSVTLLKKYAKDPDDLADAVISLARKMSEAVKNGLEELPDMPEKAEDSAE